MNLFNLFATISLDKADYDKGVKEATDQGESLGLSLIHISEPTRH